MIDPIPDPAKESLPLAAPLLELIEGEMSVMRVGPVTIPLYSTARVSATSAMLLWLRRPRVEVQTTGGMLLNPDWCDIAELRIQGEFPQRYRDGALGLIWPGQSLEVALVNTSRAVGNACVVVEGDAVRVVHWSLDCNVRKAEGRDCPDCRWKTSCHHEECERVPERAQQCEEAREGERLSEMWQGFGRARRELE